MKERQTVEPTLDFIKGAINAAIFVIRQSKSAQPDSLLAGDAVGVSVFKRDFRAMEKCRGISVHDDPSSSTLLKCPAIGLPIFSLKSSDCRALCPIQIFLPCMPVNFFRSPHPFAKAPLFLHERLLQKKTEVVRMFCRERHKKQE